MCLIIYHPYQPKFFVRLKARIARRDIICYKLLYKTKEDLITPYQHLKVDTSLPLIADFLDAAKETQGFYMAVHGIHTYKDQDILSLYSVNYILYKCIIPKGTKYYISYDKTEYCSERIHFIKQVPFINP